MRRKNKNGMLLTRVWIVLMAGVLLLTLASCDASVEPELGGAGVPINLNDDLPDPSTGCIVPTDLFADGGVGKDGIPALTNPPLVDAAQATYLAEDSRVIEWALRQTDIAHYADHLADSLSGGERQRAWIAMLLAQESPLLLLDEPTSALDLAHQYQLMALLRELNRETGRGIIAILHDVNLATRYADRIVALKGGRLFFDGTAEQLLSGDRLSALYEIGIELIDQPGQGRKIAVVS